MTKGENYAKIKHKVEAEVLLQEEKGIIRDEVLLRLVRRCEKC